MAVFAIVSEDFSNLHQSWSFRGLYRGGNGSAVLEVDIRCNAYREQSWAKVSKWTAEGFRMVSALPVEQWYDLLPSYTRPAPIAHADAEEFRRLRDELLERYAAAWWGSQEAITIKYFARPGAYDEAVSDGVMPAMETFA